MLPRLIAYAAVVICILANLAIAAAQTLPDDADAYYLVTLTQDPPTPACAALLRSLEAPDLQPILRATKRFAFTPTSPLYRARYAAAIPPTDIPTIALVRHDGGVLYKATGTAIPTGAALAAALTRTANADRTLYGSTTRPRLFPDGTRPRLIPDSVVVSPQINIPPAAIAIAVGVLVLGGLLLLATIFAALYLLLSRR